ncbi:MAG: hypothetical protein H0U51_08625 [Propionibacteriales bacterium]|nr:hypothetical protein [Propionibacteriales bacterium]
MLVAVVKETLPGEARVAMVPELVAKLTGLGYDVASVDVDALVDQVVKVSRRGEPGVCHGVILSG